jgi:hypothetical protein
MPYLPSEILEVRFPATGDYMAKVQAVPCQTGCCGVELVELREKCSLLGFSALGKIARGC